MGSARHRFAVMAAAVAVAMAIVVVPTGPSLADGDIPAIVGPDARRLSDGHYEITLDDGRKLVTHGGDPADRMGDHGTGIGPGDPERDPVCATDYYQHVLYGYRTGSTNRYGSAVAQIRSSMRRINAVLNEEGIESGNKQADFKVKCDAGNVISVGQFSAPASDFDSIVNAASAAGYNASNADYTIFWDADLSGYCGIGSYYRNDSPLASNPNNNGGGYGVTYLSCWNGRAPMHENGHNQGAVQRYAPDSTGTGGHCNDIYDVMCYAPDGGDQNQTEILTCADRMHYDCGHDSYFDVQTESGEWLETHWNIGSSVNRFIAFRPLDPNPGVSYSPSSLAFGSQTTGVTSPPKTVSVTSTGGQNLLVGSASITGVNAGDFAIAGDTCSGASLAAGASCTLTVTFTPSFEGSRAATLSIPHNAAGSPSVVSLGGTGVTPAPAASLSPISQGFGSRTAGTTSPAQRTTLTNTGNAPLVVGLVTLTGADVAQFAIPADTCSSRTVAAGAACYIDAVFSPRTSGTFSAGIWIPSNASGSPHVVPLGGTGVPPGPALTLSPASLAYGNVEPGGSATRGVAVSNTGTIGLNVTGIEIAGSASFTVASQTCTGTTIAPGSSCSVSVQFAPAGSGTFSATLRLTSDATGSPHSVPLSGTGMPPLSFSPSSLDFGAVEAGTLSGERTVTLLNESANASVSISSVQVTGPFASAFTISTPGCTGTIGPGSSCVIGVQFRPGAVGGHTATLRFNSTTTLTYSLSGSGIDTIPPESSFTTSDGAILLLNHGISFLINNQVRGTSIDSGTAVSKVAITFTNVMTGAVTIRTLTASQLTCDTPQACSWEALVPQTPGIYRVNAQATDSAAPAHTEAPGPTIMIYVL